MSFKVLELENEISQMEERLSQVKVSVALERDAWKKSARPGRNGTKWKGAATCGHGSASSKQTSQSIPSTLENSSSVDIELDIYNIMPIYWDALELAQHLQSKKLTTYAQVAVFKQITGKMLLDTPPNKLCHLFEDLASLDMDSQWKIFLHECSQLHKRQKKMAVQASTDVISPRSDGETKNISLLKDVSPPPSRVPLFPQISPRIQITGLMSTSMGAVPFNTSANPEITQLKRVSTSFRKPPSTSTVQMATCWNCGSRFPRAQGTLARGDGLSTKTIRLYCSKQCQDTIERSDISVSSSLSASIQVSIEQRDNTASHSNGLKQHKSHSFSFNQRNHTNIKPRTTAQKSKPERHGRKVTSLQAGGDISDSLGFLQVTASKAKGGTHVMISPRPPPTVNTNCMSSVLTQKQIVPSSPSVASISSTRQSSMDSSSLMIQNAHETSLRSKVYQQSKYRLDPEMYQANGVTFAACFQVMMSSCCHPIGYKDVLLPRVNLMKLQEFINVRTLYHLSLTSHTWFDLVHRSAFSDALWGFHVLRTWKKSDIDELFLHEINVLQKPERPRKMLMKLTRQLQRVVLDNMKVLWTSENWQMATVMTVSQPIRTLMRQLNAASYTSPVKGDTTAPMELYEQITIIFSKAGEIVAVRAQELIRPLGENRLLTDILQGLASGALWSINCRRLRLFSSSNRLPYDLWAHLPSCRSVFDIFWSNVSSLDDPFHSLPVWHLKVLKKLQKSMHYRLLGKESIQQIVKQCHERNGPPETFIALEKFLTRWHHGPSATAQFKRRESLVHLHQST